MSDGPGCASILFVLLLCSTNPLVYITLCSRSRGPHLPGRVWYIQSTRQQYELRTSVLLRVCTANSTKLLQESRRRHIQGALVERLKHRAAANGVERVLNVAKGAKIVPKPPRLRLCPYIAPNVDTTWPPLTYTENDNTHCTAHKFLTRTLLRFDHQARIAGQGADA